MMSPRQYVALNTVLCSIITGAVVYRFSRDLLASCWGGLAVCFFMFFLMWLAEEYKDGR
jgi:hypothetical protein